MPTIAQQGPVRTLEEERRAYQEALNGERVGYEKRIAAAKNIDPEADVGMLERRLLAVDAEMERSLEESRAAGDSHLDDDE